MTKKTKWREITIIVPQGFVPILWLARTEMGLRHKDEAISEGLMWGRVVEMAVADYLAGLRGKFIR